MIYYINHNTVEQIADSKANEKVEVKTIGEVIEKDSNGKKYTTQGVITTEKKYIETITDLYTTEDPPTVTEDQRLNLVKENGKVKWVKTDLTKEEKINKKNQEIAEIKIKLSNSNDLVIQGLAGELDKKEYDKVLEERKKEIEKIKKLEMEIKNL